MNIEEETKALLDALPGNVFRADHAARKVVFERHLLRLTGFDDDFLLDRKWLSAIAESDLIAGSLVWQPHSANSPMSTSRFLFNCANGKQIRLKVMIVPLPHIRHIKNSWVGTLFVEEGRIRPSEFVATALLERIAKLGGFVAEPPTNLGPPLWDEPLPCEASRHKPIALFANYDPVGMETIDLLLGVLGWRIIKARTIGSDLAREVTIIFINDLLSVPASVARPYSSRPTVVAVISKSAAGRDEMLAAGCRVLDLPVSVAAAEQVIEESLQ